MNKLVTDSFESDIRQYAIAEIQAKRRFLHNIEDISDLQNEDIRKVMILKFDLEFRLISPVARKVYISSEVASALNGSNQIVLNNIIDDLENGRNVSHRLSRKITKLDYQDKLLFDWGINHLHLGENTISNNSNKNGLIEGTSDLLYLCIKPTEAYLIDVRSHSSFTNIELVEIVNREWPNAYDANIIQNGKLAVSVDETGRKHLRQNNINTFTELSDGTLVMPELGYTGAGNSVRSSVAVNRMLNFLEMVKIKANGNFQDIRSYILNYSENEIDTIDMGIKFLPGGFYVYDKNTGVLLNEFFAEELKKNGF